MAWSLRGNAAWQLVQTVASTGTELLILLILAAQTSPHEFGALAVSLSGAKLMLLLCEPRIHEFLTPKLARYLGRHGDAAWQWTLWSRRTELRLNLVALVGCACIAAAIPAFSDAISRALFVAASLYGLFNTVMKFSSLAILRCLGEVRIAAGLALGGGIGKLATLLVCLASGATTALTLYALCVPAAVAGLALAGSALRRLRLRLGPPRVRAVRALRQENWRRQRHILLSNYATGLVEIGHRELDLQIVAWLAGAAEGGRYRLAKTLAMLMLEALNPFVLVLLPELARRLGLPERQQIVEFMHRITGAFVAIGVLSAALVAAFSALYLQRFAPMQQAAWVPTLVLTIGFGVLTPTMWAQAYLVAAGRPQAYLRASLVGVAVATLLAFALVRDFGATGAALAHICGLTLTCALAWLIARDHLRAHVAAD